jgi:purine-binding chemotaxis protein CheW
LQFQKNWIILNHGGEMADQILQLVTFQLGNEQYGIDIMEVDGIVGVEEVREIPNSPNYVEGIFNLRGEIIPVINLHTRFNLETMEMTEEDLLLSGFIIVRIEGMQIAVLIDKVSRVVPVKTDDIQPPPQMLTGIGAEYISGVVNQENNYLIILDVKRLFNVRELQQLEQLSY